MSKITEQDLAEYLELINDGYSQRAACKELEIPRTTMQNFLKRRQEGFSKTVDLNIFKAVSDNDYSNWEAKDKPPVSQFIKDKPTILVIADTQAKSEEDLEYLLWIGHYIAEKQPDVIVHIGDHYDFPSLSSYDKGKSSSEGRRLYKDIEAGNTGFEYLNLAMKSNPDYNPRKVFCLGNHEHRLSRYVDDNPELIGTLGVDKLPFEKYGWEVHPFLKPVEIDGIYFVHYLANPFTG